MEGSGPWVNLAAFCRSFTRDGRGLFATADFVRVVGVPREVGAPSEDEAVVVSVPFVLDLRTDRPLGVGLLTIQCTPPSGEPGASATDVIDLSEPDSIRAVDQIVTFEFVGEGVYWFDVLYGDRVLTRVPLWVRLDVLAGRPG